MRRILTAASALLALAGSTTAQAQPSAPNVLIINLDDAAYRDDLALPKAEAWIAEAGVKFTNSFVPNPLCCPSRASMFSGDQSWNTGVWSNYEDGWAIFEEWDATHTSIAERFDRGGYTTALFGKYLNRQPADHRPLGWDVWDAFGPQRAGFAEGTWTHTDGTGDAVPGIGYSTRYFGARLNDFIDAQDGSAPFFAYLGLPAPHDPATPEPRYDGSFDGYRWRPAAFNERDVSDKPNYIRRISRWTADRRARTDRLYQDRLESLLTVDDVIDDVMTNLQSHGSLSNTMIVLTSDNGYLLGEHRWVGKLVPYYGSTRVPLWIRYDGGLGSVDPAGWTYANIDVAATALTAAFGMHADDDIDGRSVLDGDPRTFLLFSRPATKRVPAYCAARDSTGTWIGYDDGFEEFYTNKAEMRSRLDRITRIKKVALRRCHQRGVLKAFG